MSLLVLHVSNHSRARCGIRNFGDQTSVALRRAGCHVDDWDGHYDTIYAKVQRGEPAYLPAQAAGYDVIHFNWHPIVINHYHPDHFPTGPLLSIYLNDIPPWSGCPVHDRADVLFAAEPSPGCVELPYPVADWIDDLPPPLPAFTVGLSGVRADGFAEVRGVCAAHGWPINESLPGEWLSFENEVRRQARSTVNVLWYHEGRGKSGGASQALASGRPALLSHSQMFSHLWPWADELYLEGHTLPLGCGLEAALGQVYRDWQAGTLRRPARVRIDAGWTRGAQRMIDTWRTTRRG